eukprot:scaffold7574_cov277-Pinguiococcus_pyrenoidosus.AAC.4
MLQYRARSDNQQRRNGRPSRSSLLRFSSRLLMRLCHAKEPPVVIQMLVGDPDHVDAAEKRRKRLILAAGADAAAASQLARCRAPRAQERQ